MTGADRYQLLPTLDDEAFASLKASVAERGVLVPVEVDETGAVLDGHHRIRAWEELRAEGVRLPDYPRAVRAGLSEVEKRQLVRALNLARRHLSQRERRALVADAIRDDPQASDRRIALVLGVSHPTVAAVRAELVEAGEVERFTTRVDARGVERPATQPPKPAPAILVRGARDERRAREALAAIGDEAPSRLIDLKAAERQARKADYERLRASATPTDHAAGSRWELRAGDFADVLDDVEAGSVDLIFCDPPYTDEFAERWRDLSALGARVLRPGGVAVFYIGHHNLPEVVDQLREHLRWLWHIAIVQPGRESRFMGTHVHNGHRDLLAFTNGPYTPRRWVRDTIVARNPADKSLHPWQQGIEAPAYLIDVLSDPDGLVLDPCVGSGTFGVAALMAGRRFLGVDADPTTLAIASQRLAKIGAGPDAEEGDAG